MDTETAEATIVAGMWVDGWTGVNKLTTTNLYEAYVPTMDYGAFQSLLQEMRDDDTCPLRGASDVPPMWDWRDNQVGLSADAVWVATYIGDRQPSLLPADLKRMK